MCLCIPSVFLLLNQKIPIPIKGRGINLALPPYLQLFIKKPPLRHHNGVFRDSPCFDNSRLLSDFLFHSDDRTFTFSDSLCIDMEPTFSVNAYDEYMKFIIIMSYSIVK